MTVVKLPEYSSSPSGLVSGLWVSGAPVSAHQVRELIRQSNAQAARRSCVYRWTGVGDYNVSDPQYAPARWQYATPFTGVPIRKAPGVSSLRVRVRLYVQSGKGIELFLRTSAWRDTRVGYQTLTGAGAVTTVDWEVPCSPDGDDTLELLWRAKVNTSSDTLVTSAQWSDLPVATFGDATWGTPTIMSVYDHTLVDRYIQTRWMTFVGTGGWRVADSDTGSVHRNGMYVSVGNELFQPTRFDGAQIAGLSPGITVCEAVSTALVGSVYTVRKLPEAQVLAWAAYEV